MQSVGYAPYKILILDDQEGPSSFGQSKKLILEERGMIVKHVIEYERAIIEVRRSNYDIIIIDLDLGRTEDGLEFQRTIREMGKIQPVIFVTGATKYQNLPLSDFIDVFASGPVSFYDKLSNTDFDIILTEAIKRVDPIKRSLYIMQEEGLGEYTFEIEDKEYSVNELLISSDESDQIINELREAFNAFLLEYISKE